MSETKKTTNVGNQQSKDDGYVSIAAKVPVWVADLLNIICEARGTGLYRIIQMCADFIIETAKVNGPVPPQMQTLLNMMKVSVDWNKAFSFSNPSARLDIAQCILILQQSEKGMPRKGFGMIMIDKPYATDPQPVMTACVDDILERVVEVSMRGLYKELLKVGEALGSQSIRETLTMLCDAALLQHLDEMDAAELPQLGEHTDMGKTIEYASKKRQHRKRTIDEYTKANNPILFTDEDYHTANQEAGHKVTGDDVVSALDCHPIGVEP